MGETILLTQPEAARLLAVSERTLFDLAAKGEIRRVRVGRAVRYPRSELERWVRERVQDGERQQ
jgi:excisionase family DNA binding protein